MVIIDDDDDEDHSGAASDQSGAASASGLLVIDLTVYSLLHPWLVTYIEKKKCRLRVNTIQEYIETWVAVLHYIGIVIK